MDSKHQSIENPEEENQGQKKGVTEQSGSLNGAPDRKREVRRFLIAVGILLVLGAALYFLYPVIRTAYQGYVMGPSVLTKVFLLPLIWLVIGWVLVQGSIVLGLIKTEKTKFSRPIHLAMLGIVLLYTAIMLPYGIETIRVMILQLQYQQNPSLYPNGFQFSPHIPAALNSLELAVMRVTLVQPALFMIPSILFRFAQRET